MACRPGAQRFAGESVKFLPRQQIRCLALHLSDSLRLLEENDVPIYRGRVARTPAEAEAAAIALGCSSRIKSRILFNKGVIMEKKGDLTPFYRKVPNNPASVGSLAQQMLSNSFEIDGAPEKQPIDSLDLRETAEPGLEGLTIELCVDREQYCPKLMLGTPKKRGTRWRPDFEVWLQYSRGITPEIQSRIMETAGLQGKLATELGGILQVMYRLFTERDMIRFFITLRKDTPGLKCEQAAVMIDDAAAKRQPDMFALRDFQQENAAEVEAEESGLVYIKMKGNVGNIVNGAGLAMATNDAIAHYGGASANFLDAGGQATKETMVKAFEIVLRDERVKVIIVNVYGGITNCAMIAESIIAATTELGPIKVPIVVRLQGTNSAAGLELLEKANLGLHVEANFGMAAEKAAQLAGPFLEDSALEGKNEEMDALDSQEARPTPQSQNRWEYVSNMFKKWL